MIFRKLLKNLLANLATWALKKHKIKLVVVSGWYATETARELCYAVIGVKHEVRRINKNPWWDFSLPLAVLGYKDERRNPLAWLWLMIKASLLLTFGKANPHTLILNLNYAHADTVRYWSSLIKPQVLMIHNFKEEHRLLKQMIKATKQINGTIIIQQQDFVKLSKNLLAYDNVFTVGNEAEAHIVISKNSNKDISFKYKSQEYTLKTTTMPGISAELLACSLAVAITEGVEPHDALYGMVKYPTSSQLLSKLRSGLL